MRVLKPPVNPARSVVQGLLAVVILLVGLQWVKNHFFDEPNPASPPPARVQSPARIPAVPEADARFAYAGDEACRACHPDHVNSFHQTAHHLTSRPPNQPAIAGDFSAGLNRLDTTNQNLHFEMQAATNGFFQTSLLRSTPTQIDRRSERFDLVVGSGRKGQSYLFWQGDRLYQLPVSYWTELGEWISSPGTEDGTIHFDREIVPRCLECHLSSFASLAPPDNRFNPASLGLGISCEKCHGPSREHIAQISKQPAPSSPPAAAVVNPARLSRNRQLDICALCHAGLGVQRAPSLSFVPGDVLGQYLDVTNPQPDDYVDVHAGQVQLLKRSRCFQSSPALSCSTCHDVHKPQRDVAELASRCLTCHQVESCGTFQKQGHEIDRKCVDCHMPLQPSVNKVTASGGRSLHPKVRNHRIGIYPPAKVP